MFRRFILFLVFIQTFLSADCVHKAIQLDEGASYYEWEGSPLPFNEMIISWNGSRPKIGSWKISYALLQNEWGDWVPYMEWGADGQTSLTQDQDTVNSLISKGFRVRVEAEGGADLSALRALHVYTGMLVDRPFDPNFFLDAEVILEVPPMSQIALNNPLSMRICSPTSTCSVCAFLSPSAIRNPLDFAALAYDQGYDIYGNWVLNVAEASNQIGSSYEAWVERGESLQAVIASLRNGIPVVISVRGPLKGSAQPYTQGHLMVIRGIDTQARKVYVMDPAFPTDEETYAIYDLDDLLKAWSRRGYPCYRFKSL